MKKLYLFILILFLCSCSNEKVGKKEILDNIDITNISVTSDSITFNMDNENNFNYKLYLNDLVVDEDNVNKENIISGLNSNTTYKLVINSKNNKLEKEIKTEKITTLRFGGDVMMTSAFENYWC